MVQNEKLSVLIYDQQKIDIQFGKQSVAIFFSMAMELNRFYRIPFWTKAISFCTLQRKNKLANIYDHDKF